MDPAHVAYQQILAAWISAGAAVVQAIGAVAAIIISIHLARSSARREREADEAAARRLEAADRAQEARDAAADQAAEARITRAKVEVHNSLINRVTSLGLLATDQCQSLVDEARIKMAGSNSNIHGGGFQSVRTDELREALPQIKTSTGDIELLEAISVLQDAIEPETIKVQGGDAYVGILENKLSRIFTAVEAIEALRR